MGGGGGRRVERDGDRGEEPLLEKSMLMTGECCHTPAATHTHISVHTYEHKCKGHMM